MATNLLKTVNIVINIILSISIIFINKWIYSRLFFPNLTLTTIHFVITFVCLSIGKQLHLFGNTPVNKLELIPMAMAFTGFVVFTNLSLEYNTVGTYQVIKMMTMPAIIAIQSFHYNQVFSRNVKLTLCALTIGVFLNSFYDLNFNLIGLFFAIIGVIVTSFYQILVCEKQKKLNLSSAQLLYYQSAISAIILIFITAIAELPQKSLFSYKWNYFDFGLIFLSAIFAFLINLSVYWIIGNTSAITYNVCGQLKFAITIVGGVLLFHDPINVMQSISITITLAGVAIYAYDKWKEDNTTKINETN